MLAVSEGIVGLATSLSIGGQSSVVGGRRYDGLGDNTARTVRKKSRKSFTKVSRQMAQAVHSYRLRGSRENAQRTEVKVDTDSEYARRTPQVVELSTTRLAKPAISRALASPLSPLPCSSLLLESVGHPTSRTKTTYQERTEN